jgi:hypothetical protein
MIFHESSREKFVSFARAAVFFLARRCYPPRFVFSLTENPFVDLCLSSLI